MSSRCCSSENIPAHGQCTSQANELAHLSCRATLHALVCVILFAGERRRRGKADRRSTELSKVIRNTLEQTICVELLPRSQIDICVQVSILCNM
jgi:ribonuclease PH